MGISSEKMSEVLREVLLRSWNEPAFYERLQREPREVLSELGWDLAPGQNMRFVMDGPGLRHLVIPTAPVEMGSPVVPF